MVFRILFIFDALIAAGFIFFLVWGLRDGSISEFNGELWAVTVLALAGILGGGWALNKRGQSGAAKVLLLLLAIPGLLFVAFFMFVIIAQPRWN